jgi:hypothetical protein
MMLGRQASRKRTLRPWRVELKNACSIATTRAWTTLHPVRPAFLRIAAASTIGRGVFPPWSPGIHAVHAMLPDDERLITLRQLARMLEASAPSPERDELLGRTRLRIVEIEARDELGPASSHPGLAWD